jgi:hypothetical protein
MPENPTPRREEGGVTMPVVRRVKIRQPGGKDAELVLSAAPVVLESALRMLREAESRGDLEDLSMEAVIPRLLTLGVSVGDVSTSSPDGVVPKLLPLLHAIAEIQSVELAWVHLYHVLAYATDEQLSELLDLPALNFARDFTQGVLRDLDEGGREAAESLRSALPSTFSYLLLNDFS